MKMQTIEQTTNEVSTESMEQTTADHYRAMQCRNRRTGIETAQRLAATGKVDMLRAGIWKPRTKPGIFEGIGAKGLPWLQQAKKLTGFQQQWK